MDSNIKFEDSLAFKHPHLADEWHPTKNGDLKPDAVTVSSGKKVWWQCEKDHEWPSVVAKRTSGTNCPFCSGKRVITGETDLVTVNPKLAKEWHPTKNGKLKPDAVTGKSAKKVWWQCDKGHEWNASIYSRNNNGCPYCSGRSAIKGETDLATVNPKLAKEWHPIKNGSLKPDAVTVGSGKKVWWKCVKGHEWDASTNSRNKNGCPYCAGLRVIKGETDLATVNPKLAKEWHPTKNGSLKPDAVTVGSGKKVWWKCVKGHEWDALIYSRNKYGCAYCAGLRVIKGETDLATVNPKLAKEWHPTKNGKLKPKEVTAQSHKKVWWRCEKGHEWESIISNRNKRGCPYCSGLQVINGETDLATVNPVLAKEWHPTKNGKLKVEEVTAKSRRKVWWQCEKGHEWQAVIANRTDKGRGCPYCSGQRAIKGETDLTTVYPKIAKEWHPTKNVNLKPEEVTAQSHKKVWWQCEKDHEWNAVIYSRNKRGCPYCSGKRVIIGETDLVSVNPRLAKEWHPTKNGALKAEEVAAQSHRKIWWQCDKGHEWEISVHNRAYGSGCPYCSGRFAVKGETDLATVKAELAKEWHPTKNGDLKPEDVAAKSHKKVWWKCKKGHEWVTAVYCRDINGCPYCSGKIPIKGETDLASVNPDLAIEWNYEKNRGSTPDMFTAFSNKKVWWICSNNHEWRTAINNRANGTGCSKCRKDGRNTRQD